jgi:hypothetical protein
LSTFFLFRQICKHISANLFQPQDFKIATIEHPQRFTQSKHDAIQNNTLKMLDFSKLPKELRILLCCAVFNSRFKQPTITYKLDLGVV